VDAFAGTQDINVWINIGTRLVFDGDGVPKFCSGIRADKIDRAAAETSAGKTASLSSALHY